MPPARALIAGFLTSDGVKLPLQNVGEALAAYVETKDMDFGSINAVKFLEAITLEIEGDSNFFDQMQLIVKRRDDMMDPLITDETIAVKTMKVHEPIRPQDSIFYRVRFEDDLVRTAWKIAAIELFGGTVAEEL